MVKGKIVLLPFPFDDLSSIKVRPALCLTNAIGEYNHLVVAFITSSVPGQILNSDLVINEADKYFSVTGLKKTSTIRLHKLLTVSCKIVLRELGRISNENLAVVDSKLKELFEIL